MATNCPKCGSEIAEGRTFCLACGAYLATPQQGTVPSVVGGGAQGPAGAVAQTRGYGVGPAIPAGPQTGPPQQGQMAPQPRSVAPTGPPQQALLIGAPVGQPPTPGQPGGAPPRGQPAGPPPGAPPASASASPNARTGPPQQQRAGVAPTMQAFSANEGASQPTPGAPQPGRAPRVTGPSQPGPDDHGATRGFGQPASPSPAGQQAQPVAQQAKPAGGGAEDLGMASTMFAADGGAEIAAALGQLEQQPGDDHGGGLEPGTTEAGGLPDNWDDDTPADAAWSDSTPAGDDEVPEPEAPPEQPAPVVARRRGASVTGPPNEPTFSPASLVKPREEPEPREPEPREAPAPRSARRPRVTSTPPPTGAVEPEAASSAPKSARGGAPAPTDVLLCAAELRGDYEALDVVSVRAEGASYGAAVEALKSELRRGCQRLGGDAVIHLRIEREDSGRVVYGTGTVVRRG